MTDSRKFFSIGVVCYLLLFSRAIRYLGDFEWANRPLFALLNVAIAVLFLLAMSQRKMPLWWHWLSLYLVVGGIAMLMFYAKRFSESGIYLDSIRNYALNVVFAPLAIGDWLFLFPLLLGYFLLKNKARQ